jgi:hypothetical protein
VGNAIVRCGDHHSARNQIVSIAIGIKVLFVHGDLHAFVKANHMPELIVDGFGMRQAEQVPEETVEVSADPALTISHSVPPIGFTMTAPS